MSSLLRIGPLNPAWMSGQCCELPQRARTKRGRRMILVHFKSKLEIRSVERGICPIATSTINERTVPIIMAGCMAHEREGYISTSGLKSDVTIVFLDPDFL